MTAFEYRFRPPYTAPRERGGMPPKFESTLIDGMLYEKDVPVTLTDGADPAKLAHEAKELANRLECLSADEIIAAGFR